jgi:transcriptional regulator with XRE-family HTH domain
MFDHRGFKRWLEMEMLRAGVGSQSDLGERIGVSGATVSRWMSGGSVPGYDDLAAIATVLGVGRRAVYEAAGLVPTRTPGELATIYAIWETLTEVERQTLADIGRVLVSRRLAGQQAEPGDDEGGGPAPR